jgi:heme-degrading monooxygenase HmoA
MKPLIARIWRTGLDESRAPQYEDFAQTVSLPMFRRHDGLSGVLFARSRAGQRVVITLWEDQAAADALGKSDDYRATVQALEATGLLRPPQEIELLHIHGSWTSPLGGR